MKVQKLSYDISLLRSDKVIHTHNLTSSDRQQVINQLFSIYMCALSSTTESVRTIAVLFDSAKLLRSMTLCTCIVTSTSRETLRVPGTSERAPAGSALMHAGCYTANPDQACVSPKHVNQMKGDMFVVRHHGWRFVVVCGVPGYMNIM